MDNKIDDPYKEIERLNEKIDAYKRLCRTVQAETNMPELLIENPEVLFGKQDITEEDIKWAKGVIEKYERRELE